MLNKPKYMIPSTNMQECTVDVNDSDMTFSCIVDGNEAVYAWRIRIYKLENNALVYDTGKITTAKNDSPILPFLPVNEKNQNVVFSVKLNDYPNTTGVTQFVNAQEYYYWTIEFWSYVDKNKDIPTTISCEEVFCANSSVDLTLMYKVEEGDYLSVPAKETFVLSSNKCTFKLKYTQAQDIPLKRYGWRITDSFSGQVLVDTISDNQIYGTAENILCSYIGFLNDNNYKVEAYVETQNNASFFITPINIVVSYATTKVENDFLTEFIPNESAIINDWRGIVSYEGRVTKGTVEYVHNYPIVANGVTSLKIPEDTVVTYDYATTAKMDIADSSYIVLSTQLEDTSQLRSGESRTLFYAQGSNANKEAIYRMLSFVAQSTGGYFEYKIRISGIKEYTYVVTPSQKPSSRVWYIITMKPYTGSENPLSVVTRIEKNGLYPSETLYPSAAVFPTVGEWGN